MKKYWSGWLGSVRDRIIRPQIRRGRHRRKLSLEALETRTTPSAVPTVSLSAPAQTFIGETAQVTLTFTNTGSEPGYSPWAYVVLDTTGHDGSDGISYVANSASYLGSSVTTVVDSFGSGGTVTGPSFSRDPATDMPLTLTGGTPGNEVVFFQLPFGSFAVGQPGATIDFTVSMSDLAYLNSPLSLQARGGFALGNTPLDEGPPTDPPILGSSVSTSINPVLFTVTNTYLGPEDETATGANFEQQFKVTVDIANGQTISNLEIQDLLPDSIQYLLLNSARVDGALVSPTFLDTPSTTTPGGTLEVDLGTAVGTSGSDDADLTFTFYVPRDRATPPNPALTAVLNLSTGAFVTVDTQASAQGTWTPLNPAESAGTVTSNTAIGPLQEKSIATQKTVSVLGGGEVRPGSVLLYTINFQVSDYFAFQSVVLPDTLGDGIRFDAAFAPTFSFAQEGGTASTGAFNPANYNVGAVSASDGSQTITFDLSNELITRGQSGKMIGGSIPATGTGNSATLPANTNPSPHGATQGTVVFEAIIQQNYSVETSPNGNKNVKQGDILNNTAAVTGSLLSYADVTTTTGSTPLDNTAASVEVERGLLTKTIYAVNGAAPTSADPKVTVGDLVTYRLTYLLPTSTVENFVLTDYLPLPIFNALQMTNSFGSSVSSSVPAVDTAKFGPGVAAPPAGFSVPAGTVDYSTIFGPSGQNLSNYLPAITAQGPTNTVTFTFPKNLQDDPQQRTSLVDILFTVQVGPEPFADGLFLTNQANATEGSTNDGTTQANTIGQIEVTEPSVVRILQGVVATSAPSASFSANPPAPVTFNAPGTVGARFTGTINSNGLLSTPIDSNLSGLQAGQLVTFATVVENDGTGRMGAFDVDLGDSLPAGLIIPTAGTGLNLQVVDGSGAPMSFTTLTGGLFGNGIELNDPGPTPGQSDGTNAGALDPYDPFNGHNIAVVTYDLQVANSALPAEVMTSTATLDNYSNLPGGTNFLNAPLTAPASVIDENVSPNKTLITTSEPSTSGSNVAVGEIVRYRLQVQVPQLNSPGFQLQDNLPAGMLFLNDGTATAALVSDDNGLVSSTLSGTGLDVAGDETNIANIVPTFALPSSAIEGSPFADGTAPVFDFGTLTNNDRNSHLEYVVVDFNALVENVASNTVGASLPNNVSVLVNGNALATSNSVPVTVALPALHVTKNVSPSTAEEGDTVVFTVTVTNNGTATAFDTTLADTLPMYLNMAPSGESYMTAGATGVTDTSSGNTVSLDIATMPVGSSITVTYSAIVQPGVVPNQQLDDSTLVETTTLPGTNGTPDSNSSNQTGSSDTGTPGSSTGERTGSGVGPNNLDKTVNGIVTIEVPTPVKSIIASSEASTSGSNVAIGEVVRYELVAQLPRATMNAFQIDDLLPAGLSFLGGNTLVALVSSTGTAITSSTLGSAPDVASSNVSSVTPTYDLDGVSGGITTDASGHPVFNLGNLVNSGSGSVPEYAVVEFNALVDNAASNTDGTMLNNTFETLISGSVSGPVSNGIVATVVEPTINNLTKMLSETTGDAGDTVTYTVTWSNTGDATAFNVTMSDPLPGAETLMGVPSVMTTGSVSGLSTAGTSGNTVGISLTSMAPGSSVTATYSAVISNSVLPLEQIKSSASLTYTSLPGTNGTTSNATGGQTPGAPGSATGERDGSGTLTQDDYDDSAPGTFTVTAPTLTKIVTATSLVGTTGNNVNIDEQVTYTVTATLNEGSFLSGLQLTDALPAGLTYVSSQITAIGSQIGGSALGVGASGTLSGSNVIFNLGSGVVDTPDNVSNAKDQIVFQVVATVADVAGNTAGTSIVNPATLYFGTGTTAPATATVAVVEPSLHLSKSVIGDSTLDASATATYQVVISNPSGGSAGDAFDLAITDPIPSGLTLVPGSVSVTSAPGYATTNVGSGSSVTVGVSELRAGDSVTIQYKATIVAPPAGSAAAPGATVTNTATVNYDSFPGTGGRAGTPASGSSSITVNSNTISGNIYADTDHSGGFNAGDSLITGQSLRVELYGMDTLGDSVTTIVSTSNGTYQFTGLRPGTYSIEELDQPTGYLDYKDTAGDPGNPFGGTLGAVGVDTISNITIPADSNQTVADYNFGKVKPSSIVGTVYVDQNANGILNTGEPGIGGVSMLLTGTDDLGNSVHMSTSSSMTNGSFGFSGLRPGTYILTETSQPSGYADGVNAAGSAGGMVQPSPADQITAIVLNQVSATGYNFGKVLLGSLAGYVYNDSDNDNGVKDAGEPGIGNVSVQLTGTNDLNQSVNLSTTTSTLDGSFRFTSLQPGNYTLTEGTQPAGFSPGIASPGNLGGTVAPLPATQISGIMLVSGSAGINYDFPEEQPPATANNTVDVVENGSYTFKIADFPFSDPIPGSSLKAVKIVTLPATGSLTLNGNSVTAGQTIAVGQISLLKYTPPANQIGVPLTTFTFSVSDGISSSTHATMSVDVFGPPAIIPIGNIYLNNCTTFPLATTGSFTDPSNIGPFTGTVNYGDGSAVQSLSVSPAKTFTLSHNYLQRGVYNVCVTITDGLGLSNTTSFLLEAHRTFPTQAASQLITINDGSAQRSMIVGITVSFPVHENLSAGAITVTTSVGQAVGIRTLSQDLNGQTVVLVQFTGANVIAGSLPDGRYNISVNGSLIHDNQGTAFDGGGTITQNFFRLFGDVNGDDQVNAADLAVMNAALRSRDGTPQYLWYLDYDQNCVIDTADYTQFLLRKGKTE